MGFWVVGCVCFGCVDGEVVVRGVRVVLFVFWCWRMGCGKDFWV